MRQENEKYNMKGLPVCIMLAAVNKCFEKCQQKIHKMACNVDNFNSLCFAFKSEWLAEMSITECSREL